MTLTTRAIALGCCAVIGAGLALPVAAASGPAAPAAHAVAVVVNRPRTAVATPSTVNTSWSASAWSGYAESGTFTGASGTWTVPTVAASATATYSSTWVGLDGFSNTSLIQAGTEQDFTGGTAHYSAWWEILPAAESPLPAATFPVAPGNRMKASIYERSATTTVTSGATSTVEHLWVVTLSDTTKGWTFTTTQPYRGPGTSAEWIQEAPLVNGAVSTLAHYTVTAPSGTGDFDNAGVLRTAVASGSPAFAGAGLSYAADAGGMVQNKVSVSTPGGADAAHTAFNVAYGSRLPAIPAG